MAIVLWSFSMPARARNAWVKLTSGLVGLLPNFVRPACRHASIASSAIIDAAACQVFRARSTLSVRPNARNATVSMSFKHSNAATRAGPKGGRPTASDTSPINGGRTLFSVLRASRGHARQAPTPV